MSLFQAQHYTYSGHSAAVSSIAYTSGDSHLLSTGGKDTAILQWKFN